MGNEFISALENSQMALLEFDDLILGLPQSHILTIESLNNVKAVRTTEKSSGTVSYGSSEIPVYTLNNDLVLMEKTATNNRFCIAIKQSDENESFAVMCDAIKQYTIEDNTNIKAMPSLMHNLDSPVIGLMKKDDTLVLIFNAESMRSYIYSQEAI